MIFASRIQDPVIFLGTVFVVLKGYSTYLQLFLLLSMLSQQQIHWATFFTLVIWHFRNNWSIQKMKKSFQEFSVSHICFHFTYRNVNNRNSLFCHETSMAKRINLKNWRFLFRLIPFSSTWHFFCKQNHSTNLHFFLKIVYRCRSQWHFFKYERFSKF